MYRETKRKSSILHLENILSKRKLLPALVLYLSNTKGSLFQLLQDKDQVFPRVAGCQTQKLGIPSPVDFTRRFYSIVPKFLKKIIDTAESSAYFPCVVPEPCRLWKWPLSKLVQLHTCQQCEADKYATGTSMQLARPTTPNM